MTTVLKKATQLEVFKKAATPVGDETTIKNFLVWWLKDCETDVGVSDGETKIIVEYWHSPQQFYFYSGNTWQEIFLNHYAQKVDQYYCEDGDEGEIELMELDKYEYSGIYDLILYSRTLNDSEE